MADKILNVISKFFKRTFCCFSLLTLVMAVVGTVIKTNEYSKYIAADRILGFFLFSLLFALSFAIADIVKENSIIRRALQFVLTSISMAAVFLFGPAFGSYVDVNNVQNKGFSILAICFMYVIIYVVFGVISLAFGALRKKLTGCDKEYNSIFENK